MNLIDNPTLEDFLGRANAMKLKLKLMDYEKLVDIVKVIDSSELGKSCVKGELSREEIDEDDLLDAEVISFDIDVDNNGSPYVEIELDGSRDEEEDEDEEDEDDE